MSCLRKNGFTLIEMLVVIAIIGILAAMLMPTLNQALEASRSMLCSNNLKQIGSLAHQYADDNGEWFPAPRWGKPASETNWGGYIWSVHLSKYTPVLLTSFSDKNLDGTIFDCPETGANQWNQQTPNYGWNANLPPPHGWSGIETHALRTRITKPSDTGMISDCTWFYIGWGTNYDVRHNDKTFIPLIFCDLHLETLPEFEYAAANMKGY